ncbi:hypothetical protein B566_EDAN014461 [Ephemera danica]|nr:hypothetical protein B566_EDAN014461 [Ephemera danica]
MDFVCKPLSLNELTKWKATEMRQILLYTGPLVLEMFYQRAYINMFFHFLTYARDLLHYFVLNFGTLYEVVQYNNPLQQLVRRINEPNERSTLFSLLVNIPKFIVRKLYSEKLTFGLSALCYNAISFVDFKITCSSPNYCVLLDTGEIVVVTYSRELFITGAVTKRMEGDGKCLTMEDYVDRSKSQEQLPNINLNFNTVHGQPEHILLSQNTIMTQKPDDYGYNPTNCESKEHMLAEVRSALKTKPLKQVKGRSRSRIGSYTAKIFSNKMESNDREASQKKLNNDTIDSYLDGALPSLSECFKRYAEFPAINLINEVGGININSKLIEDDIYDGTKMSTLTIDVFSVNVPSSTPKMDKRKSTGENISKATDSSQNIDNMDTGTDDEHEESFHEKSLSSFDVSEVGQCATPYSPYFINETVWWLGVLRSGWFNT